MNKTIVSEIIAALPPDEPSLLLNIAHLAHEHTDTENAVTAFGEVEVTAYGENDNSLIASATWSDATSNFRVSIEEAQIVFDSRAVADAEDRYEATLPLNDIRTELRIWQGSQYGL